MDDWQLLQSYARDGSEAAFAELVGRHIHWVNSVALRQVNDPSIAQDVVQSVFVLLARKARALQPGTLVGGWLFRTTRHVAAHARRAELRRKIRETTAHAMSSDSISPHADEDIIWQQISPHLDNAVAALSERDRSVVLLRFYEKMPLRKIGEALGMSEEAAKKRVTRALERMRAYLDHHGARVGAVALGAILTDRTVGTASAALAARVSKSAVAASASTGALLPYLARETLGAWRWAKVKLAIGWVAGSAALILVGLNAGGWFSHKSTASSPTTVHDLSVTNTLARASSNQSPDNAAGAVNPSVRGAARKTGAVTGLVVDEHGHPIQNASVWGGFCDQPFAQDTTDASGWFALDKITDPRFVTVTAPGFAADQQELPSDTAAHVLMFRLNRFAPLRVRTVDEAGQPISGVRVFIYQWWGRRGTLGQRSSERTDAAGRWASFSPPKGELILECAKSGHRYSRTNRLSADGKEHVIVLHPALALSGHVTDADTGALVSSFSFTPGHSQPWAPSDPVPMWDSRSEPASNGFYKTTITEEQIPFLRIEAQDYETVEVEIHLSNAVEVVQDFQLKRQSASNSIRGTVLLPNGAPAAGVEVALCTATAGVMLRGTAFEHTAFGNLQKAEKYAYRRTTDEQGSFSFDPKPGAHTLVAVCPDGIAKVRCFDSSQPLEMRMKPWGRIEGTVRTRDGNWAGRKVRWSPPGPLTDWMTLFYESEPVCSDETGKFIIEHVLPSAGRVCINDGPGMPNIVSPVVEVKPGQTVQLQIGGIGRQVTGKLVAPPGVEVRSWNNQVTFAQLHVQWQPYDVPKDLTGNAAERWRLEFEDTDAGHAWFRDQYSYQFKVEEDGSFCIPEVLPGKYVLFVNVAQPPLGSGPSLTPRRSDDPLIATSGTKFSVSGDSASPLDLGEVMLHANR